MIPFFRYPDESLLGQESGLRPAGPLRLERIARRACASTTCSARTRTAPARASRCGRAPSRCPDLAVGRLVETAGRDRRRDRRLPRTADGVVAPASSLVTGYDFLADAADAVQAELAGRDGRRVRPLDHRPHDNVAAGSARRGPPTSCARSCSAARHDVIFLAGHFSANSALAADFTTSLLTTELAASTVDLTNALVFSAGCHSGYNLVDGDAVPGVTQTLDWAQAFARKRATLVAGTGYQYGDTDFLEYSERLYRNFAQRAAHRHRRGVRRRGARAGEAATTSPTTPDDARHPREGAARGDRLRPADARRQHARRAHSCAAERGVDRRSRSPVGPRRRRSACARSTSASRPGLATNTDTLTNSRRHAATATWLRRP